MTTNLFEVNVARPIDTVETEKTQNNTSPALPFFVNCLLVCSDPVISNGISQYLNDINNFSLSSHQRFPDNYEEYQLVILVYSARDSQTVVDIERAGTDGKQVILVGDDIPATIMRQAIQQQIKDFILLGNFEDEIFPAIERVVDSIALTLKLAPIISVLNGKGGSGASFICHGIGQIMSEQYKDKIALYDGDFHHGSLANIMGLEPEYYIDDALSEVRNLDGIAIKSMMSKAHDLCLLPVKPYSYMAELSSFENKDISLLINKMRYNFELIIADLSRGIEMNNTNLVGLSDVIYIVLQQNISSIRESKALVRNLVDWQNIDKSKIHLIVNRYSTKYSSITLQDIANAIGIDSVFVVQNNYELASAATDLGKPLAQIEGAKHITGELTDIVRATSPITMELNDSKPGIWARLTGKNTRNQR
ncbi:AAA family ATPase [Thalassotalea litorea]|uniref:AAA family ATPase n=1 Tax=Thalassotalea litorea TaxID=2020715 RepID=UPI003735EFAE